MLRARLSELVAFTPGRAEMALRLALVCTLTTLVAQVYETPNPALTTYLAFFMAKPDRTSSVLSSVVMTVLISMVIGMLLILATMVLDEPSLRVLVMASLSVSLLFIAYSSKLKPLGSTVTLILAYALDALGGAPAGELATRALLYAWLFVAIPAGVTIVVSLLIGPAPRRLAERAIAARLRAAQALLNAPAEGSRARSAALRRQGTGGIQGLLRLSMLDGTSARPDLMALQKAVRSTDALMMIAEAVDRRSELPPEWRDAAGRTLDEMAAIFETHRYPVEIDPLECAGAVHSRQDATLVADFNEALAGFAVPEPSSGKVLPREKTGFFAPDAFTNPAYVRQSLKVTLAAMVCYLFYSLADWPGIHTCLITCYIVALDTTAETVEKLALRIAGALVGAAAGLAAIIWLTPQLDRVEGLLALVFAGGLAGGWIAAGSPRIAYAGFQVSFAFFLCVIQGSSPDFDLAVARDRVVGILLGNAVIYFIFSTVWPVSIVTRVDAEIAALIAGLRRTAGLVRSSRRDGLAAQHAAAAKVRMDLETARYEPMPSRPSEEWFREREMLLDDLRASETDLLIGGDSTSLDAAAAQFEAIATEPPESAAVGADGTLENAHAH
jgi:multidrug resistance protein MdtO